MNKATHPSKWTIVPFLNDTKLNVLSFILFPRVMNYTGWHVPYMWHAERPCPLWVKAQLKETMSLLQGFYALHNRGVSTITQNNDQRN